MHSIAKQPTSSESDLSGSIPAELGNLTSLTKLDLSYNSLSGDKYLLKVIVPEMCSDVLHYLLCFTLSDSALQYMIEYD